MTVLETSDAAGVDAPGAALSRLPRRWSKRRWLGIAATASYLVLLDVRIETKGLSTDPIAVLLMVWLGTVAWNVGARPTEHLRVLRDWTLPALLFLGYKESEGFSDTFGVPVHYTAPIRFDEWLTGGHTVTDVLQRHLCGVPCTFDSPTHWWDTVFTLTYVTHFVAGMTIAAVLYFRSREVWGAWMRRYLGLNLCGLVGYVVYPAAPPWLASDEGLLPHGTTRLTGRGFASIGLHLTQLVSGPAGNPVAAIPSLHAGTAFLVAAFGISRGRTRWRWLLALYPTSMILALLYFSEHYVLDILLGIALACLVMVACGRWEAARGRRRAGS